MSASGNGMSDDNHASRVERLERAFGLTEPPRRPSAWRRVAIAGMAVGSLGGLMLIVAAEGATEILLQTFKVFFLLVFLAYFVGEDFYSGSVGGRYAEHGRILRAVAIPLTIPGSALFLAAGVYDLAGTNAALITGVSWILLIMALLVWNKHRRRTKQVSNFSDTK